MIRRALATALLVGAAPGAAGQDAAAGGAGAPLPFARAVAPETVTVGDRFTSVVRVLAPPGSRVTFRGLPVSDALQPTDTVRIIAAAADSGATAAYALTAWVAEAPLAATARVRVVAPDGGAAEYDVPLVLPAVRSVLPAGVRDLEPRPARGVLPLPRSRALWPWLLLAGIAGVGLALLGWRGRRPRSPPHAATPRELALERLERIDAGTDPSLAYAAGARVLRRYLAEVRADLGEEWTTAELLQRARSPGGPDPVRLEALLAEADGVKFARQPASGADAAAFLVATRELVERYPPPATPERSPMEAA